MKLLIGALCILAVGTAGPRAQTAPDFSGTWTMDPTRSEAAAQGAEIGPVTVAIRQTAGEIRIETTREGAVQAVRYVPAGARPAADTDASGTFRWDGATLVTTLNAYISKQAVTVTEARRLNAAGTEMTVDVTLVVQHGYQSFGSSAVRSHVSPNTSTGTNVFVRSR